MHDFRVSVEQHERCKTTTHSHDFWAAAIACCEGCARLAVLVFRSTPLWARQNDPRKGEMITSRTKLRCKHRLYVCDYSTSHKSVSSVLRACN